MDGPLLSIVVREYLCAAGHKIIPLIMSEISY